MELNNPLLLPWRARSWKGQLCNDAEPSLCTFVTPEMGYRAAWIWLDNLHYHLTRHAKPFCLRSIVQAWYRGDRSKKSIVRRIAKLSDLDPDEILKAPPLDAARFCDLVAALTAEGQHIFLHQVDYCALRTGFKLAFGHTTGTDLVV